MQWNEMECNGMQWNAMECNGMQSNAIECNRVQSIAIECIRVQSNTKGKERKGWNADSSVPSPPHLQGRRAEVFRNRRITSPGDETPRRPPHQAERRRAAGGRGERGRARAVERARRDDRAAEHLCGRPRHRHRVCGCCRGPPTAQHPRHRTTTHEAEGVTKKGGRRGRRAARACAAEPPTMIATALLTANATVRAG